jgi:hypothetical protein
MGDVIYIHLNASRINDYDTIKNWVQDFFETTHAKHTEFIVIANIRDSGKCDIFHEAAAWMKTKQNYLHTMHSNELNHWLLFIGNGEVKDISTNALVVLMNDNITNKSVKYIINDVDFDVKTDMSEDKRVQMVDMFHATMADMLKIQCTYPL